MAERRIVERLATEGDLPVQTVEATVELLEAGFAAPYIARYCRERTGAPPEAAIQWLERGLGHFDVLGRRKATILKRIEDQGLLSDELRAQVDACLDRNELEDLYLPYRPKRRTRGTLAKERGLEPLARALFEQRPEAPSLEELAAGFVAPARGVPDAAGALEGARHIITEWVAENPHVRRRLRELLARSGIVRARVAQGKEGQRSKYEMYYDFSESASKIPSHRVLAIRRGEKEHWLTVRVEVDRGEAIQILRGAALAAPEAITAPAIEAAIADAYDRLLAPALEAATRADLKRRADAEAIGIFSRNLRNLLLQPPAGRRRTLGVDPGYRTGCKLAALDEDGRLLQHATIFPHPPQSQADEARNLVRSLLDTHRVEAVAIGNGTASRETDLFFRKLFAETPAQRPVCMTVNEAGASVYANSRAARSEFPDLDPAVRSAVSIGRRFQNPLNELVQVDPKMIGVGQYQHDVNQQALRQALETVVRSCVNAVGVDPNAAPVALLAYVAGFDRAAAHELTQYRELHGPLKTLDELRAVPRVTEQRFEQAAPFLRIHGGPQPLDATAIHPRHYGLVERMAADAGLDVPSLLGNGPAVKNIDVAAYASDQAGKATLFAIRAELLHPGRDPRRPFRRVEFRDDITDLEHLEAGMILEGAVTNVTNFGAFVDIGVHEDGLVHVSQLARRYVGDPNDAVHVGDIVRVKVLSVDAERRRIGLSIKQAMPPPKRKPRKGPRQKGKAHEQPKKPKRPPNAKATAEDIARLIAHFQGP